MPVSFKNDIKPLFRPIDVDHMKRYGVVLDDYAYMSDGTGDHANARGGIEHFDEKDDATWWTVLAPRPARSVCEVDVRWLSDLNTC
jgi:hypothetical protein